MSCGWLKVPKDKVNNALTQPLGWRDCCVASVGCLLFAVCKNNSIGLQNCFAEHFGKTNIVEGGNYRGEITEHILQFHS